MSKENRDRIVSHIYETPDHKKFFLVKENRGKKEKGGLAQRKVRSIVRMIKDGLWIPEIGTIKVIELPDGRLKILDGAHRYMAHVICEKPIRYEIMTDERLQNLSIKEFITIVSRINSMVTHWSKDEMFKAAVQTKYELAIVMNDLITSHKNKFTFMDLLALLTKDPSFFTGHSSSNEKMDVSIFGRSDLKSYYKTLEFQADLKSFVPLHDKMRVANDRSRKLLLKSVYTIVYRGGHLIRPKKFLEIITSIPDNMIKNIELKHIRPCSEFLLNYYNRKTDNPVKVKTILDEISIFERAKKNNEEPTLKMIELD